MGFGQTRDLEATARSLEGWLRSRLPGAERVAVSDLSPPGNGFSNETLLFDLAWSAAGREQREQLVVRLEPAFPVFPEYDLSLQFRVMQLLEPTGVPVPRARWYEPDPSALGGAFYVMEQVDGDIPSDMPPYHSQGFCTELALADREAIWWSGLEVMARIHQLDWRTVGFDFLDAPGRGATPLARQLREYSHFLEWARGGKPHPTCEAALRWLEANQPADEPAALCWGDARIPNMIFRDGRCVAVLDWEMVTLGNPEQDLGWWIFMDWHHSAGIEVPRLEGLPSRQQTVARYEEWMGRPVRHLEYYEVFAATRFAVIMIRVAQHLEARGIPLPEPDLALDNPCTRALARMLDLPPPGS